MKAALHFSVDGRGTHCRTAQEVGAEELLAIDLLAQVARARRAKQPEWADIRQIAPPRTG